MIWLRVALQFYNDVCQCALVGVLGQSKSVTTKICSRRGFRQISSPTESCDVTNDEAEKRVHLTERDSKPKCDQTEGATVKGGPVGKKQGRRYILFVGRHDVQCALLIC